MEPASELTGPLQSEQVVTLSDYIILEAPLITSGTAMTNVV